MHVLLPSNPIAPRQPDEIFEPQLEAFRSAGHSVSLLHDSVIESATPLRSVPPGASVLYRGWMLSIEQYGRLVEAIHGANARPFTSLAQYEAAHHLPRWYSLISELTPETLVFTDLSNLEGELRALDWPAFFIKDFVKSLKTGPGAVVRDPSEISALINQMKRFRGQVEGGICVRRVEQFQPESEVRFFVIHGVPHAADPAQPIPSVVNLCAHRIPSPFFSVDVALRADGVERVIEIGDGQVSDLVGWQPESFVQRFRGDA